MPRYLCSSCHEVVELSGSMRFDWCTACGEPLSPESMLPIRLSPPRRPLATAPTPHEPELEAPAT